MRYEPVVLALVTLCCGDRPVGEATPLRADTALSAVISDTFSDAPDTAESFAATASLPAAALPDPLLETPDTGTVATARELSNLSAILEVPVQGVMRTQLHDSYTEARGGRVHEAMDILAPRGTPVLSAADGKLLKLFDSKAGGLMVYAADPSNRFILLYGHLDSYAPGLVNGMALTRGQLLGYVGTTGNAPVNTPHLHFGIMRGHPATSWYQGVATNPYPLFVHPQP